MEVPTQLIRLHDYNTLVDLPPHNHHVASRTFTNSLLQKEVATTAIAHVLESKIASMYNSLRLSYQI